MQKNNENDAPREAFLQRLKRIVLHNWPWKLLSLFLAVCLWGALISQDGTLTREKTFNDITVNVVNTDTLRRNGYIIVSGLEQLGTVRIKADVPQKVYDTVTANNFNVRVDLSKITHAGEQTLYLTATSSSTYGTVKDISIESVTVQVEEYVTRSRIPVKLQTTGEAPEGFYADTASVDPAYVTVSGPKSLVSTIVRCVADYDLSILTAQSGTERSAIPFHLVNMLDETVSMELIDVTSESVLLDSLLVEQKVYSKKALLINAMDVTTGEPASGYVIRQISSEPASVYLAGSDAVVQSLNALPLKDFIASPIDVTGLTATVRRAVRLEKPAGVAYISSDTIFVTVEITPK